MAERTSVVRTRVTIDERAYDAKPQGGGKFDVVTTSGVRVGKFAIAGRQIEVEDFGIAGSDPVERIALLWVRASLSPQEWVTKKVAPPAPVPEPKPEPAPAPAAPAPAAAAPEPAPAPPPAPDPAPVPAPAPAPRAPEPAPEPQPTEAPAAIQSLPPGPFERAAQAAAKPSEGEIPRGKSICRIATHPKPDPVTFQKAKTYMAWLRSQPGVSAAYLTHDAQTGKTVSVTIWATRQHLAAIRDASPPAGAVQLKSLSVDLLWIVG